MTQEGMSRRDFLKRAAGSLAAGLTGALTFGTRRARAAPPDPSRVVVVRNPLAWLGGGTTNDQIDAAVARDMVDTGLRQLTGTGTLEDALRALIPGTPSYDTAKVAIKVNVINGNLPTHQKVVSPIIDGLLAIGFQGSNITIYGQHSDKVASGFSNETRVAKALPTSWTSTTSPIVYGSDTYNVQWAQCLDDADWQINVAVYKDHWTGDTAVTLCSKNNLGSINKSAAGFPCAGPELVPLNSHPNLSPHWIAGMGGKCVLYVIDAIFGSITGNGPGNPVDCQPQRLYFSCDPINIDYTGWNDMNNIEGVSQPTPGHLEPGESAGLGVRDLSKVVRIDMDDTPPDVQARSAQLEGTVDDDSGNTPPSVTVAGSDRPVDAATGRWSSQDVTISSNPQTIPVSARDSSDNPVRLDVDLDISP